ncbi:hypothetical protein CAEBREN_05075 [Caenorhabditis brenneri]|uniref:SCP domain-containing protein n=1 Tax=Caenorhabditis brenneri TaxID=135651 RepID=G0MHU9_CAEBE|nr:hypothetical protein CAEBREN_05075 [Caenorhabditis brenneri]
MTASEEEKEFIDQILVEHNTRRQRHNAPDLEYNEELSEMAQQWADKLAKQAHISFSELSGVGENITFFPPDIDAESVVEHWYQEHEKYEYETPGWQTGTNYFTQVIWRSTKKIGVGCAYVKKSHESDEDNTSCSNGSVCKSLTSLSSNGKLAAEGDKVIVAFYRPAGNNNRSGQFAANVLKPII